MLTHTPQYRALVNDYRNVADRGGDFRMLKTLKILRSIIVNLGIISVCLYGLAYTGADATWLSVLTIVTLGLYNGVEAADYMALVEAFTQAKQSQQQE